jgi:hypothetical protein
VILFLKEINKRTSNFVGCQHLVFQTIKGLIRS